MIVNNFFWEGWGTPPKKIIDYLFKCNFLKIRMLKNEAQIASENSKTTLEFPTNLAKSELGSALVMCVRAHNLLRPPPKKKKKWKCWIRPDFVCTLLVIKMEYFFRSNIETYCFFFGSFITLEQVNDYVMILEYQGEINICKILRYVTWPFVWSYGRPNVPYSVFFPASSLCTMNPCFFRVNVTFVTKTDTRVL